MVDNAARPAVTPSSCKYRTRFSGEINLELNKLGKLDNYHVVGALLTDYLIIAVAIALYFVSAWLLPITLVVIASRQRALLTLLHESAHSTLAEHRGWNFFCGTALSGWLVFQTFHAYQQSHVRKHHGALGDPLLDPDTASYARQGLFRPNYDKRAFLKDVLRKSLCVDFIPYVMHLFRDRLMPEGWATCSKRQRYEYLCFICFWGVLVAVLWRCDALAYFFLCWMMPYLTFTASLGWLIELSEHYPLAAYSDVDLHVTRNRTSGPIERFLTGAHAEQFHLTHHLRPRIPFWNIEKAHICMLRDARYRESVKWSTGIFSSPESSLPTILEEIYESIPRGHRSRWDESSPHE